MPKGKNPRICFCRCLCLCFCPVLAVILSEAKDPDRLHSLIPLKPFRPKTNPTVTTASKLKPNMHPIPLANTTRQTTRLGFGCGSLMGATNRRDSLKLLEIAFEAGYSDQPHLVHDFRHFTGTSPKEFFRSTSPRNLPIFYK